MNIDYDVQHLDAEGLLPLLTSSQMKSADRVAIDDLDMGGKVLMEIAGRACAETAIDILRATGGIRASIVCGKGNNGGDGYVVARQLLLRGFAIRVYSVAPPDELSPDARHQFNVLQELSREFEPDVADLRTFESEDFTAADGADLWIDALLGTGLTDELREPYRAIVEKLSEARVPVLAVDIPSGLSADTGQILGAAARADVTVTMGAVKVGMVIGSGPEYCGRIVVAEIGIPPSTIAGYATASLSTDPAVSAWLPRRAHDAHKYSAGMVLVIGGSEGMTGAPIMTARAAARGGAGYVMVACQDSIQRIIAGKLTAITSTSLPSARDHGIDSDGAMRALEEPMAKASAVVIGPGLGRRTSTVEFVIDFLRHADIPTVIDADALYAISQRSDGLGLVAGSRHLLTPHAGEFRRLSGGDDDAATPIEVASAFARRHGTSLLLKGSPSVVASPEGKVYVCGTGNSALATAGTGDVLAGLSASLLSRGLDASRAGAAALHLGGSAADHYARRREGSSMIATDLLRVLPAILKSRFDQ